MRTPHALAGLVAAAAGLLLGPSCLDVGYQLPGPDAGRITRHDGGTLTPTTAIDGGEVLDAGAECVQGVVDPMEDGHVIRVLALNVDRRTITVARGDVITWINEDTMRHGMVAGAPGAPLPIARGGFDTGEFGFGEKRSIRVCNPGTLVYFCSTHPAQMTGYRIIVE